MEKEGGKTQMRVGDLIVLCHIQFSWLSSVSWFCRYDQERDVGPICTMLAILL